ncbi:MAG: hypothetical protein HY042_06575 [Spirochaetia bacterium]|nr:hypothetical protein [Spirochaetia bacterium]
MKNWMLLAVTLLLPVGLFAGDEFVPGDARINERDILDRMAKELGEQPSAKQKAVQPQEKKKTDQGPADLFDISVVLAGGERAEGKAVFSQPAIILEIEGEKTARMEIPLAQVKSITFEKWTVAKKGSGTGRFYFVPSKCTVLMRAGGTVSGIPRVQDIMQINLTGGRAFRSYYTAGDQSAAVPASTLATIEFAKDNATAGLSN